MKEEENILRILKETRQSLEEENYSNLKNLSNQTINTASLTQDMDNIIVAVVIYSLSKVLLRNGEKISDKKRFIKKLDQYLLYSIEDIEKGDEKKFRKDFEKIRKELMQVSGKMKSYIEDVFRKASINKASKIYEHGISMERTASLLGVTMYELAGYTGQKEDVSTKGKELNIKKRVELARKFFKTKD